jgi:hypothetical protein
MTPPMPDIFTLLDEVQTLARNGLHYATNSDDRERYARLLTLVAQSYAALLGVPEATILAREAHELGQITPKVGADAAIFNPDGETLSMDRRCAIVQRRRRAPARDTRALCPGGPPDVACRHTFACHLGLSACT